MEYLGSVYVTLILLCQCLLDFCSDTTQYGDKEALCGCCDLSRCMPDIAASKSVSVNNSANEHLCNTQNPDMAAA